MNPNIMNENPLMFFDRAVNAQRSQLLTQLLDVIADNAVIDVHIALVIEHIEGAGYIDFKGRGNILGFLFLL